MDDLQTLEISNPPEREERTEWPADEPVARLSVTNSLLSTYAQHHVALDSNLIGQSWDIKIGVSHIKRKIANSSPPPSSHFAIEIDSNTVSKNHATIGT